MNRWCGTILAAVVVATVPAAGCLRKTAGDAAAEGEIRGVPVGVAGAPRVDGGRPPAPSVGAPSVETPLAGARTVPEGYQVTEMPGGQGRILRASFSGNARSAHTTLGGMLGNLARQYFDARPEVVGAVASEDDQRAQAIFHARVGGMASTALMVVELERGNGRVTVLLDEAGRFRATVGRMAQVAAQGREGAQGGPAVAPRPIQWVRHQFPDGSGNINLPSDWRMQSAAKGAVDAMGPNGEVIGLGGPYIVNTNQWYAQSGYLTGPYMKPVQAMQYLFPQMARTAARNGYQKQLVRILEVQEFQEQGVPAAYILYDCMVNGRPYRFYEMDTTRMIDQSMWMFYSSVVGAPQEVFAREFGTLVQIWQSWQISNQLIASRLRSAVESMRQAGEILRSANQSTSATYDRVNRGWSLYFRGNELVEHIPTGGRGEVDHNYAQRMVEKLNEAEGGQSWRVVPMRDY